jgi:hypothetical protein
LTRIKLLFTCPHGGKNDGRLENPPIPTRDSTHFPDYICPAKDGQGFEKLNDALTLELTDAIVDNIQTLSGKEPYKVTAEFNRELIDYNRNERCAFEQSSPKAKQKYREYHDYILQRIEEMLPGDDKSMAFLFDIHGTTLEKSPEPEHKSTFIEVIFGTDQRRSREALTKKDPDYFWGTNGLFELLKAKHIRAYPKNESQEMEDYPLDGGHTIKTYGTNGNKPGLVAIQIEAINCIRDNRYCREKFAADMADCILKFVSPFIKE